MDSCTWRLAKCETWTRVLCVLSGILALPAQGYSQSPLSVGERLRIHMVDGSEVTGALQYSSIDQLAIRISDGSDIFVPTDDIDVRVAIDRISGEGPWVG